jgi:alpha-glucosidase (family GH31 glycosyl hydrolase)
MKKIPLLPQELWWGGLVNHELTQPWGEAPYAWDLQGNANNQSAPLLLSNRGRWVWSDRHFKFEFGSKKLSVSGPAPLHLNQAPGGDLRSAYRAASAHYFPPSGKVPPEAFFRAPQYNTWIEMLYEPTQAGVLRYAQDLIRHGFPPGVLMIDSGWHGAYGDWTFNPRTFPDPTALIRELHRMKFKVMLWIMPVVSPDQKIYRKLRDLGGLVRNAEGKPVIREWWDGHSALLDLTGGPGREWFMATLRRLQREHGVDGFKFDGGDFYFYADGDVTAVPTHRHGQVEAYAQLAAEFPYNELRGCWKMGGQPLVQRLWDKFHAWGGNGLATLIPYSIAQGLLGHPFICPDMIGGGEYLNFLALNGSLDSELIVRNAQCVALMPMMQFSVAPWRVLDAAHLALVREAAALHTRFAARIVRLARAAAKDGEPILRSLEYNHPGQGYARVQDQFMLGTEVVVAPVVTRGAKQRRVQLPAGRWRSDDSAVIAGPTVFETPTPLARLPHYTRIGRAA